MHESGEDFSAGGADFKSSDVINSVWINNHLQLLYVYNQA